MAGALVRPRPTFDLAIADRQWRGVLLASTLLAVLAGASVMGTPRGRQALVDQWERTAAAVGHEVDDAGYGRLEALSQYGPLYAVVVALLSGPVLAFGIAGLLHLTFARQPVRPGFTAALSVVVHAGVVLSVRAVLAAVLTYTRETTASALSIGAWFPALDAASPAARALGFVDIFVLWWVCLVAIGTARLYHRRTRATAAGFLGVYLALALLTAAAFAAAGGPS